MQEATSDIMQIARIEVEPEDVTELLQSNDKVPVDEGLLYRWGESSFLRKDSIPGKDGMKTVEQQSSLLSSNLCCKTTKDLEYYIDFVDKAAAEFERTDSNSERSFTVGKTLSKSIAHHREIICEKNSQSR